MSCVSRYSFYTGRSLSPEFTTSEGSPVSEAEPSSLIEKCFSEQQIQEIKDSFLALAGKIYAFIQKHKVPCSKEIQHAIVSQCQVFFRYSQARELSLLQLRGNTAGCEEEFFSEDILAPVFLRLNTSKIEQFTCQFHPGISKESIDIALDIVAVHKELTYNDDDAYLLVIIPLEQLVPYLLGDVLLFSLEEARKELPPFLLKTEIPCIVLGFCKDSYSAIHDVYTKCSDSVIKKSGESELLSLV